VYHIVEGLGLSKFITELGDFGMDDLKKEMNLVEKKTNKTTDICSQEVE